MFRDNFKYLLKDDTILLVSFQIEMSWHYVKYLYLFGLNLTYVLVGLKLNLLDLLLIRVMHDSCRIDQPNESGASGLTLNKKTISY